MSQQITTACLDMAGTTVADDGSVMTAFGAAVAEGGLIPGAPGYDQAIAYVQATMGQSKIEVFRAVLGGEERAQRANTRVRVALRRGGPGGRRQPAARRGGDDHGAARGRDQGVPGHRLRARPPGTRCWTRSAGGRSSTWPCRPPTRAAAAPGRTCR